MKCSFSPKKKRFPVKILRNFFISGTKILERKFGSKLKMKTVRLKNHNFNFTDVSCKSVQSYNARWTVSRGCGKFVPSNATKEYRQWRSKSSVGIIRNITQGKKKNVWKVSAAIKVIVKKTDRFVEWAYIQNRNVLYTVIHFSRKENERNKANILGILAERWKRISSSLSLFWHIASIFCSILHRPDVCCVVN